MTTIVIMPGGFHPYHAGHHALYQSAKRTFPNAEVYVAATNDTSSRPFPFAVKEKLAKLAGVEAGHFVQVSSPFRAAEITSKYNPEQDTLIFVRSEKDAKSQPLPGGVKKDGSPSYLQPLLGAKKLEPFAKHAYMAYLPTVEFGPGMTSATQIRSAWPSLDDRRKTALVMSLYPKAQGNAKLAATVVKLLDAAIGGEQGVAEGSLSEIDRRGFLKGMGAAAVAGAAGGAKAQEVKFDVAARIAVQKAQTAIGKFFTVKFGGEQSRIMDYIAQNVNKAVLAYCMDTNGYNVLEVIDYATDSAYRAADAVPPSITDRGGAKTAISTANTFMDAYTAAILQKLNEYTKAGRSRQQSQPQQQAQQQRSGAKDIFTPEYANLNLALTLYIISKDSNPEIHTQVKDTLNQYIQNNNNKEFVNDAYRAIVSTIESARKRDPEVQTRREDSFIKAHKSIIDNLNKSAPKDEFKESVEKGVAEGSLNEGLAHPVIVVDVQPEYSGMNDGDESAVFPQIINFVNKQTGPVLMFVNAEDQGLSGDTVAAIQTYWEDTIDPDWYDNDPDTNPINWSRFQIVDKGYGYFRGWMDAGIEPSTIIATIRELYQQHKNDSRELQFPPFNKRTTQQSLIQGAMEELNDEPLSVNWTSVAQLKRFNGAYLVGGARDQCLREVELLMNAFNIKYKRIDSLIYEGQQGVAEGAPFVVPLAPIHIRNPKKAPQPFRNQGDIVPPTKPPSTEKRGVKGRPGQRPMPKYDEGMTEAAKKCPPATQDITLNLNNRQKAINEYGYGPLNPDLPNTKFWMKKVDEWNLDSMEEAQSSLCGNCAAFDIRQDTLDCIAQGIDSSSPEDAEGVIDAGDLGYCKFLKFKCASRRTCDAWVTGGPLADKPVDENQGWAATYESSRVDLATDPELTQARRFAQQHYPEFGGDEDMAFAKWVQRGLGHSEKNDKDHDRKLKQLTAKVDNMQLKIQQQAKNPDYMEESSRKI